MIFQFRDELTPKLLIKNDRPIVGAASIGLKSYTIFDVFDVAPWT